MKVFSLSATSSSASSFWRYLSVRQSLPSSTQARARFFWCSLSLPSKRSKRVNASAVLPAKPAITCPSARRRTLRAVPLRIVLSKVTWPSPASATFPSRRTQRMVVPWNIRDRLTGRPLDCHVPGEASREIQQVPSRARVRGVVDLLELLPADVGVALGGGQAGVAQQLLDAAHV